MTSDAELERLVEESKSIVRTNGISRESLDAVLLLMEQAAAIPGRWTSDRYADPDAGERQARYLIRSENNGDFTLYLNVMRPGKRIPPHNHTTWACIAAVDGIEHNTLFERTDGDTGPGAATLRVLGEKAVQPGQGIALLPDDIHAVEIRGDKPIRHLHFYGKALESLSERLVFDTATGEAKIMTMSVATRR